MGFGFPIAHHVVLFGSKPMTPEMHRIDTSDVAWNRKTKNLKTKLKKKEMKKYECL
jgi:hypothetical protein